MQHTITHLRDFKIVLANIKGIKIPTINPIINNASLKHWHYIPYVLGKGRKACKLFVEVAHDKKGFRFLNNIEDSNIKNRLKVVTRSVPH